MRDGGGAPPCCFVQKQSRGSRHSTTPAPAQQRTNHCLCQSVAMAAGRPPPAVPHPMQQLSPSLQFNSHANSSLPTCIARHQRFRQKLSWASRPAAPGGAAGRWLLIRRPRTPPKAQTAVTSAACRLRRARPWVPQPACRSAFTMRQRPTTSRSCRCVLLPGRAAAGRRRCRRAAAAAPRELLPRRCCRAAAAALRRHHHHHHHPPLPPTITTAAARRPRRGRCRRRYAWTCGARPQTPQRARARSTGQMARAAPRCSGQRRKTSCRRRRL